MTGPKWRVGKGIAVRLLALLLVAEAPLVVFTVSLALQNDRLQAQDAVSRVAAAQSGALGRLAGKLAAARAIAAAARSLPVALVADPAECANVLASLMEANDGHVASIALRDAGGAAVCATGANAAGVVVPVAGRVGLTGLGDRLELIQPLSPAPGAVTVTLAPGAVDPRAPQFLWARVGGTWVAAGPAPTGALPRAALPDAGPAQSRGVARNGWAFLYTTAPMPAGLGGPGDFLLAGTDVRHAASASARTFGLRIAQLAGFFLAESLLVAAGVHLVASRPLRRLNEAVERWRTQGRFTGLSPHGEPAEVGVLANSFAQASASLDQRERELKTSIAHQDLLMQEIHHRVKNNLQIIASLLNLQAARIKAPEARAEFQSARDRVRALATLHRHLYAQGDLHLIDMRAFFAELCSQMFQAQDETEGDRIAVEIVAPGVNISSDQAVPIALIVTETVGNAVKYAFPAGRRGRIQVIFEPAGETHATLTVRDDGVGRPDGLRDDGLGLQLVRGFARQLGAQLTISTDCGTCYRLDMAIERQRRNTIALGKAARS